MLVDTHCHLDFPILADQIDAVVARAQQHGVTRFVVPAVAAEHFERVVTLASHHAFGFALGLHPCFLSEHSATSLKALEQALQTYQPLAVGEIGLDFYHGLDTSEQQLALFKAQLRLAKRFELPVILHVRKAHDQVLKVLRELQFQQGGVVHAFSGSAAQAERYIGFGFKLGVGGVISHERAMRVKKLFAALPLDALVLETDAPDMPLQGAQGKPNEPAAVARVAQLLADLQGVSVEEVAQRTTANALALFPGLPTTS